MRQTEKKKARLGRYGHPDFVGQFKPAATFPVFFNNEYLNMDSDNYWRLRKRSPPLIKK
jgi:hypothetical protein